MAFQIHPLERFVKFKRWTHRVDEVGYFSIGPKREYLNDDSQRKVLGISEEQSSFVIDVKKEFKKLKKRIELVGNEELDFLLKWITHNQKSIKQVNKVLTDGATPRPHFACWRSVITKILGTPYEERDGWKIGVTLYHGVYYLYDVTEKINRKNIKITDEDMCQIFRHYLITNDPKKKDSPSGSIDPNACFCAVCQMNVDSHILLVADTTDCCNIIPSGAPMQKYIDVRINKDISSPKDYWFLKRYRMLKWWSGCEAMGIPRVIWGHINDKDMIVKCTIHTVEEMLQVSEPDKWNPTVCLNFCNGLLNFIKESITKDDPQIIYLLEFSLGNDVTCTELETSDKYVGLPEWYVQDD